MLGIHVADDTEQRNCHQLSLSHSILFDNYVADVLQILPVPRWVCCFWKENNKLQETLYVWMPMYMVCIFIFPRGEEHGINHQHLSSTKGWRKHRPIYLDPHLCVCLSCMNDQINMLVPRMFADVSYTF